MKHRLVRRSRLVQGRLAQKLRTRESSETLGLVFSAVAIGVLVGLAAVGFHELVHHMGSFVHVTRVRLGAVWGPLVVMLIPAIGGLLITPIVVRFAPDVRGSGIPAVMLAVSNMGGRVAKRVIFWRPIASTLSIGTGASLGTEGPVVQLGAAIASALADAMRLGAERRRSLVAVAAASGIAASFGAPIAGVLFALEVILGRFSNRYFGAVVIGAVSASVVSRALLGDDPAFAVPLYHPGNTLEFPLYAALGLVCAVASVAFIRLLVASETVMDRVKLSPWLRPGFGGLLIGAFGLLLPEVLGRGYSTTETILRGEVAAVGFLLALALGKTLATGVSLASWGSGGIFAPVLMVGAALGAAFGHLAEAQLPALAISPGAYALLGMGALFSGATRAPMSSVMMIFEISDNFSLILPLLLAAVVATLLSELLHGESVYTVMLKRRGLSLARLREGDLLQTVRVREVMDEAVPSLPADAPIGQLEGALATTHHHGFLLLEGERFVGVVTLSDLERARARGLPPEARLIDIGSRAVVSALPDEPISEVLERMAQANIGRVPVVSAREPKRAIGWLRQSDLARAYYRAVTRERQLDEGQEARRLRELTGQEVIEVRLRRNSPLAGKTLLEAALPKESIVVAIRRRGKTVFPHGDTRLEPGDVVVASVAPGFSEAFRERFERGA